jgi:hypothetical protein
MSVETNWIRSKDPWKDWVPLITSEAALTTEEVRALGVGEALNARPI